MRRAIASAVMAAVLAAGCGGSSHKSATTTHAASTPTTTASGPATTSSAPEPAITRHLPTASEIPPGFSPSGPPSVSTTIQQLLTFDETPPSQMAPETAIYKRLGFVAAASQGLNGAGGGGVANVEQFRSPAGARGELANSLATFDGGPGSRVNFSVPGVPHSGGWAGEGSDSGINVAFAAGDYYYLVGEEANAPANRAGVIAAAQKLYHRVNG
ncbi:MAG TPA: hypothetical protein VMD09_12285 [Solirubrobacteraceae bacterium]|nr:hypothetical protein [Solirubrobacteraceae bacterium]